MQRTVTVVAAPTGAVADVRMCADGDLRIADVLPDLQRAVGVTGSIAVGSRVTDARTRLQEIPDGAVLTIGAGPAAAPMGAPAVVLEVTSGPEAGRTVALPAGTHVLGRDGPLHIPDAAMSRRHAEVRVDADGSTVVLDLDSRNGSRLGDLALPPAVPTPWPSGTLLRVGATTLVHARVRSPAATAPAAGGLVTVAPPPRLLEEPAARAVRFPRAPERAEPGRLPLLASLAPLAAGLVLALILRRWEFAAFALMSPLVVLGQAAGDRRATARKNRAAAAAHAAATAEAEAELATALRDEAAALHDRAPDLAAVVAAATDRTALLWQRRAGDADAMVVRVGLGDLQPRTTVEGGTGPPALRDVPVCLDLRRTTSVGVRGPELTAVALVRSLVVQLAALHGPASLQLVVLAPGRIASWAWLRWLPHLRGDVAPASLASTAAQVRLRLDELAAPPAHGRHTVVIVDGVRETALGDRLAARPQTSVLWVARGDEALPPGCAAVVEAAADGTRTTVRQAGTEDVVVAPDVVPEGVAESVARALAPLRDASAPAAASLPATVPWSVLHDIALGDPEMAGAALARAWRAGPTTTVTIGVGEAGPVSLDLQADGPHLLVAGTTGAGKSELLQTLVASLVAGNSPADLNLLLVDFKGGAAFGACAELPHTIALLTDLDQAATTRALASLSAELRRRERLFAEAGVVDLDGWWAAAGCRQLPRLVIVVDEFATLADELPDFLDGLVGIAQRGRSLGIHLVLATQRPEGAVSADIRANTRLRICLAVARETESRDVIDSPRAVTISRSTPGRAFVRVGAHELREVQTARVAAPWTPRSPRVEVYPLPLWGEVPAPPPAAADETELDLLVAAARVAAGAASASALQAPQALWLPPLPDEIGIAALPPAPAGAAGVGLVDLPHEQRQSPLELAVDADDPLLVVGGARSGRSTTAVTVATALAAVVSPDDLHVFAIDSGRALQALDRLPHTGAVVDVRDVERVERLLAYLLAEVERRRNATADEPRLLLVVDGWDAMVAATGDLDGGRCQESLLRLLATGGSAGVRVVVTSDRAGLSGRLAATVAEKICLRLADRADFALLGVAARQVPAELPAGRGLRARDQAWLQVAVTDDATRAAAMRWGPPARPPRRFDPLPHRVPLHAVARPTGVVVGIRSDDLAPLVLDPGETGVLLVAGPPGSGRSTTLVSLAAQLKDRPVVALCPRRGPMRSRRDLALVPDPADGDALEAALRALDEDAALLVDDIDLVEDPRTLDAIEAAVRRAREGAGFVVLAGATDAMSAAFRGPVARARRSRTGLLLRPEGPHDGELLGLRLRRRSGAADPPGRGILALDGIGVPVQVPDPT